MYVQGHLKLPPGSFPPPPYHWPPKPGPMGPHPKFASAAFTPGHTPGFLALPPKAVSHGGMQKPGIPLAGPGSKSPIRPGSTIASPKGPIPGGIDRRTQLAQERAKMEGERQEIQRAKLGGGPEGMPRREGRVSPRSEPFRPPVTRSPLPPHSPAPPPPSADQLRQQRLAQEQARIQQLQQKQQGGGIAPGSQPPHSPGPGMPPSGGAPGGTPRPPKSYGPQGGGGPATSRAGGGFGLRPPTGGQPAGVAQGPQPGPGQVRPPVQRGGGGVVRGPQPGPGQPHPPAPKGGGGGVKPAQQQQKKEKSQP
jgi:translation initiation factor IF-2